jgi:hypothetical protein
VRIGLNNTGTPTSANRGTGAAYTGDGTSSLYIWGAQIEQRSSVTAYTATTTAPITNYIPALQTAASGVARFEHNPVTGESLGLEIEEQRTNIALYGEEIGGTSWSQGRTITLLNSKVAPNGSLTASKIVGNPALIGNKRLYELLTTANSTTYTFSVYAKAGELPRMRLMFGNQSESEYTNGSSFFDLANGVVVSGTGTITAVGNGWYRCSVFATTTGTASAVYIYPVNESNSANFTGDGYSGIYVWGAQLEAGSFATSYIPTVASQVTRVADLAIMTGTNFSSWYRADEGTVYTEAEAKTTSFVAYFGGVSSNEFYTRMSASGPSFAVVTNGTTQANFGSSALTAKIANAYKVNDFASSVNGGVSATDTSGTIPLVNVLSIGATPTTAIVINGTMKKLAYYPKRLQNSELQALTTI